MIKFDQFKAMDIRVAKVLACEDHPNADKLYVLTIDVGEGTRKVVAGVKQFYSKEELLNKSVVALTNLESATIRGVESQGMVLATKDDKTLALLAPERDIKVGSPIS